MADITNKNLEQLLSTDEAEKQVAKDQIRENILDELNKPLIRRSILAALGTNPDNVRGIANINFADQLSSVQRALNNLSVDTTDQTEIDRLNEQRKALRKQVNLITIQALKERIGDFNSDIARTAPAPAPALLALQLTLRRKIFSSLLQEAIESNDGIKLNNDQVRDFLVGFYNNTDVFPTALASRDKQNLFWNVVGFSAAVPTGLNFVPSSISTTIERNLRIDTQPSSSTFIKNILQESYNQYLAWGGIDSIEQKEINDAKPLMQELRENLSNDVMFYESDELLNLLLNDAPLVAPFNTTEATRLIPQFRRLLGVGADQRTQRLARIFNLEISYNPDNVYQQADTRATILNHLNSWHEAPSAEIQDCLRNRINSAIEESVDNFDTNPDALDRILTKYISEIKEIDLFGEDEDLRIRNAYRFFYLELTVRPPAPTLPISEIDLRAVIASYLDQATPHATSILTTHNNSVDRMNNTVRDRTYDAITNQANGLMLPLTNETVDNASERTIRRLTTTDHFTLEEIGKALYLPTDKRNRTDIARDISNKIRALRTNIRFAENPNKRLSDTEINTMLVPFMPNCERIVEELMRIMPITGALNSYTYRTQLESVLNDPSTNTRLYLKFKEIAGNYGNITDISMLQDISMHRALKTHGYTLNLTQVLNAGFRPNPRLRSYIQNNNVPFDEAIRSYNNTFEFIRERYRFIESIPEANRNAEQNTELELLTEMNTNIQVFNDLLREISENYRNISSRPNDDKAKILYIILQKKYNTTNSTATPLFIGLFPGASSMEENIAQCYKSLVSLSTVFVPRVEENTKVPEIDPVTGQAKLDAAGNPIMINARDAERLPMENDRKTYAKNRRNLQKWMWFSRPKKDALEDSRRDYLQSSRNYTLSQIQDEFPDSDFEGNHDQVDQRKIDRRNRILELLNTERRNLFDEELQAQTSGEGPIRRGYNKFRNFWRNHKGLRLAGSAVCLGGALTGAALGAPAMALGAFVVSGAALRGVSTYMGWTAGWEALRNRFGATKQLDRTKISAMNPDEVRNAMAAQTTLALSEKGQPHTIAGSNPAHSPVTIPMRVLNRPVTDGNLDRAEATNVNAMFSSKYIEQSSPTPDSEYYRQNSSRELWANQNQRMRELIDTEFNNGNDIESVLNSVYLEEEKLMKAIEEREVKIRKSNTKKHLTGAGLGLLMGVGIPGLVALKDWIFPGDVPPAPVVGNVPHPSPVPSPVPAPVPNPVPSPIPVPLPRDVDLIIPDRVFAPYVGNADLALNPGLNVDETPGIWQSIGNKLGMSYGTGVFDSNATIKAALLTDNPQLGSALRGVHTGDAIHISPKTAELMADALNSNPHYPNNFTSIQILRDLHKPWPQANM